jgi:hypothetical protein
MGTRVVRVVSSSVVASSAFAGFVALAPPLRAQSPNERVSVDVNGAPGAAEQYGANPASDDGRYVVFTSPQTNLVPGGTNGKDQIYVRDRVLGVNVLVSVSSSGVQGNDSSVTPWISGDGRLVVFRSAADNLVAGDTNHWPDIFLHDRDPDGNGVFDEGNETTIRVNLKSDGSQSDDYSDNPVISGDGTIVAFQSKSNLAPGGGLIQVYTYNVSSGKVKCASVGPNGVNAGGDSTNPSISYDASKVSFESYGSFLVSGDTNSRKDVFVRDRSNAVTLLVSVASDGTQGDKDSFDARISSDGTTVAFSSRADNLVSGDTNGDYDLFVHDLVSGVTERVSVASGGAQVSGDSFHPALSSDGKLVVYYTSVTSLVPNDVNGGYDVVLYDRTTGLVEPISTDCMGWAANAASMNPWISSDGRYVTFVSSASNLVGDGLGGTAAFLHDRTILWPQASMQNYDVGWPGTHGVPSLTSNALPQYGATIDLTAANSYGHWTVGFLLIGTSQASIPTSFGGSLLVAPFEIEAVAVSPSGYTESDDIPFDETLCGAEFDLQMVELDAGASAGVSFTPGLQLLIGQ